MDLDQMALDDRTNQLFLDQSATAEAIKTLLRTGKGDLDDTETKTELDEENINLHTQASIISEILEMTPEEFNNKCILGKLVEKKERKLISKDRQSRSEIVKIAMRGQQFIQEEEPNKERGFFKRMFSSNKPKY